MSKLVEDLGPKNNQVKLVTETNHLATEDTALKIKEIMEQEAAAKKINDTRQSLTQSGEATWVNKLMEANNIEQAKNVQDALQDMVQSANVISSTLENSNHGTHKLTKEEIEK